MCSTIPLKSKSFTLLKQLKTRLAKINSLFLGTVIIPTLLSIIYFGFIASETVQCWFEVKQDFYFRHFPFLQIIHTVTECSW